MNSPHEFERLHAAIRVLADGGFARKAALATITRTRGSTFRRAGTSMLVHADGDVVCALSGGCPQRDIALRAREVIASDRPVVARYNRDSGLDVLMEMGCGGELDVLIEPLARPGDARFLDALAEYHRTRAGGFIATLFARNGAALAPRPRRLVSAGTSEWKDLDDDDVAVRLRRLGGMVTASAAVHELETPDGRFDVLIEVLRPTHALHAFGVNAASIALVRIAVSLGWSATLIDHVEPGDALPAGTNFVRASPESLRELVRFDQFSSAVVMTFNVARDIAWLDALADAPLAYLGAIGSRERSARMLTSVDTARARLHAPAGLDLGAETPEEIALSVAAEVLASVNERAGSSLSTSSLPIHAR